MDLKGVTFNSKPLDKYSLSELADSLGFPNEVTEIIREEEGKKNLIYRDGKLSFGSRGRSGKVRYLSDSQIREEYGMEAKPHQFKTLVEEIIHLIYTNPKITVSEIERSLGRKKASLSGIVSRMYVRLQKYMVRQRDRNREYIYGIVNVPPESEDPVKFLAGIHSIPIRKQKKEIKQDNEKIEEDLNKVVVENALGMVEKLKETFGDLNITLKVEGQIKILFGFEKANPFVGEL